MKSIPGTKNVDVQPAKIPLNFSDINQQFMSEKGGEAPKIEPAAATDYQMGTVETGGEF